MSPMTGRRLAFRIVNVFVAEGRRLSGNALAVFEDAEGLDDATMQALALQLNLAETTFLFPPDAATSSARVRIFTPTGEMPFAGHPTLGTAFVARALGRAGDALTLEMKAGLVPVSARGDRFRLRAPVAPTAREVSLAPDDLARVLQLPPGSVLPGSAWIHTGTEQLMVPASSADAVIAARPDPVLLGDVGAGTRGEPCAYLFASDGPERIVARFFYRAHGAVVEDPATGSACANLGGWLSLRGARGIERLVHQGDQVARPSRLQLAIDDDGGIFVAGDVAPVGAGFIDVD
jgi:trans-2,3-dihydro-3-hydroxyanthranilate isomerase